ncbi:hypothetical protein [Anaerostipes sp. Marseille-Q3525]|uniref:hypothetical protein n=1 Tax=Anaerostipes sp. Marseille-Q3525 TaxID=2758418 RepID=UPI001BAC424E|nr:hypothetical protein [Anaerostipes sp. Marseille-Q3525]MBR9961863.1 hypothetical protein [Anaerostipes sp. Marseille-Q3525]
MDENKTGVWIKMRNGEKLRYDHDWMEPFGVGDLVEINSEDMYVNFKIVTVESRNNSSITTYRIKPQLRIDRTLHPYDVAKFRNAEAIVMDVNKYSQALIIVPFWYNKKLYRNQRIRSSEVAITIKRIEKLKTMNEDIEIQTGTILADEIKIGTLATPPLSERRVSALPLYQQTPITATSEAIKNFKKEYYGTFGAERELKSQIPTTELGQTLKKISDRMGDITISDLGESHIEFKEKEMYTKNLKEMIKKPIYVDKEITVKEPMLDNNGKQIEKDGKPVFKVKHYHGMVKILWVSGAETVAYVEGNDVYDRENGFKTCVLKYLCGNAGAHDAVDFWTNKYVKYPSSRVEVTENLCKLEEIIENDKHREEERKGLPHAKFLRRTVDRLVPSFSDDKLHYAPEDEKLANEFKKLAKKYFPELKCREIYINDRKQEDVFVAIK